MLDLSYYGYNGFKPKPTLNLKWYDGNDTYSDGDIEDTILKIIAQNDTTDYTEAINKNYSWPVFYHLTHIRQNILNWYPFEKNSSILEIGCGMGAITELLCKRCKKVTSVELSKRRAEATYIRCRNFSNLEIIVGNLNNIKFDEQFDYITLIGVLEHQGTYTASNDPFKDFLCKIKSLLKPNGRLLIAIENKYGLKYWCGAYEDHTGTPFEGLNQYVFNSTAKTFSRQELNDLVKSSGFSNTYFYYPLPDYKFPQVIYSDEYLPKNPSIDNWIPYYYPDTKTLIANEGIIYKDIIENEVFPFFSNSFLVECAEKKEILGDVKYIVTSPLRKSEYRISTVLDNFGFSKIGDHASDVHLQNIANIHKTLCKNGVHAASINKNGYKLNIETINGYSLTSVFINTYKSKNINSILSLWNKLYSEIKNSSEPTLPNNNVLIKLGILSSYVLDENDKLMSHGYLDLIHRNCFVDQNGQFTWIDQEWDINGLPASVIIFYNIYNLYNANNWMNNIITTDQLLKHFNIYKYKNSYTILCQTFLQSVLDDNVVKAYGNLTNIRLSEITDNIYRLSSHRHLQDPDTAKIDSLLSSGNIEKAIEFVMTLNDETILKKFPKIPQFIVKYMTSSEEDKLCMRNTFLSYHDIEQSDQF